MRAGGVGSRTILVCCSVGFAEPAVNTLLELMPPLLVVRGGGTRDAVLPSLLDALVDEVLNRRADAATAVTRLADVVPTRVLCAWVESRSKVTDAWFAAGRDPQIGRAPAASHRRLGEPSSVESLADVARVSRFNLSERFASLIGVPPARWRMPISARSAPGR